MGSFALPWPFGGRSEKGKKGDRSKERKEDEQLEEFGVTPQLLGFVKGFTAATFKDFLLEDGDGGGGRLRSDRPATNVSKDLSDWQERHAMLVLSKAKEISQLRYILCPRHLKEQQFWRIYFLLVKTYVAPYEKLAIQKAKIRAMELEDKKAADKTPIEVEMTEAKHTNGLT